MIRKIFTFALTCFIVSGCYVLSSCTSDDEETSSEQTSVATQTPMLLMNNTLSTLKDNLTRVNYSDLQSLASQLKENGTTAKYTSGSLNSVNKNVITGLINVIESVIPQMNDAHKQSYTFTNIKQTMSLTWSFYDVVASDTTNGSYHGENANMSKVGFRFVGKNDTVYTVTIGKGDGVETADGDTQWGHTRNLLIKKDDATLLSVEVQHINDFSITNQIPAFNVTLSGKVVYDGNQYSINYSQSDMYNRIVNINYAKGGESMVAATFALKDTVGITFPFFNVSMDYTLSMMKGLMEVKGLVNNLNRFVIDGTAVAGATVLGTLTESACQKIADNFNKDMTAELYLVGADYGKMSACCERDSTNNRYKPSLKFASPLFGGKSMTLEEILASMGLKMQDVIDLMKP